MLILKYSCKTWPACILTCPVCMDPRLFKCGKDLAKLSNKPMWPLFWMETNHFILLLLFPRPERVRQHLHLHRWWGHRIWWRAGSRHSCGVHLWCSWGYNLPVNSLLYLHDDPDFLLNVLKHNSERLTLIFFSVSPHPPHPSMTPLFFHRLLMTQWKLLTTVGN